MTSRHVVLDFTIFHINYFLTFKKHLSTYIVELNNKAVTIRREKFKSKPPWKKQYPPLLINQRKLLFSIIY